MSKFMKITILVLVLGLTVTVYKVSTKKGGDQTVTTAEPESQDGNNKDETASNAEGSGNKTESGAEDVSPTRKMPVIGTIVDGKVVSAPASSTVVAPPVADGAASGTPNTTSGMANAPGTAGTAGAENTAGTAPGATAPNAEALKKDPEDRTCYAFEYKHQKAALNKDIEDFLDYSNAFPIFHDKATEKSICVKVNGKPTAFKISKYKDQKEVVVGSVVGPDSLIRVSYCVNTSACKEACAVKTNRFMDDLMSDAGDEDEFKESWGDAKEQKKELQAKVKEFRNVASENRDLQKQSTIRSWDTVQQNEWFCKKEK